METSYSHQSAFYNIYKVENWGAAKIKMEESIGYKNSF